MRIVADNLNIIDPVIDKALRAKDPEPIRQIVKRCVQAGAQAFGLNSGPLPRHER